MEHDSVTRVKKIAGAVVASLAAAAVGAVVLGRTVEARKAEYQADGTLIGSALAGPARIVRDEKAMPYVLAGSLDDALFVQGFAVAQDRFLQMHLLRSVAKGRLSEIAGDKGLEVDERALKFGFLAAARRHASLLAAEDRRFLRRFADGVNLFLSRRDDHPLELKLAGIQPEPWQIEDSLAIMYLMGWNSAANYRAELLAFDLQQKLGARVHELIGATARSEPGGPAPAPSRGRERRERGELGSAETRQILTVAEVSEPDRLLAVGSNAWAVDSTKAKGGAPLLANDPHLDNLVLPGPFHASAIIIPGRRVVGVSVPGIPGIVAGRNERLAVGFTNAYGDAQDVVRYDLDPSEPGAYFERGERRRFGEEHHDLRVKDGGAPGGFRIVPVTVLTTPRGRVFKKTDRVAFVIRWSSLETMSEHLGIDYLFVADTVADAREKLRAITYIQLNVVMADKAGNIGLQVTGRYPIRRRGNGALPVNESVEEDDWIGWVPFERNPSESNPPRGWIANANQDTTPPGYPGMYSSYFSPEYRYERLRELLDGSPSFSAAEFLAMQQDVKNPLAVRLVPVFVAALRDASDTKPLGDLLVGWDCRDERSSTAATVYHRLYERTAVLTFEDELGPELTRAMLSDWYVWQKPFERFLLEGSPWFDRADTPEHETREAIIQRAARELASTDADFASPAPWAEANVLRMRHPLGRDGLKADLFRGIDFHLPGSGETLFRARAPFGERDVAVAQTMRMVVDLADDEKVAGTLNGGTVGRTGSTHLFDQAGTMYAGDTLYWWFSDAAIERQKRHELRMVPR
jgi:penicillin amidase